LSYPKSDPDHTLLGPAPSSFSGKRALNFVLENEVGTIDKTILINVKCVRVDKKGRYGKYVRGDFATPEERTEQARRQTCYLPVI